MGALLALGSGCVTLIDQASLAQQQADFDSMNEDVQRLNEKLNGIQLEQQALARELETLRKAPREDLVTRNRLDTLDRQVQALSAARESDRKQIVSDLSHKVAAIVGTSSSSSSSGRSGGAAESGYEHVVESGQTLSAIAAAYKVSVLSIKKANNLKSDMVRVGQKLFIPKK
jgi:predicted RNase H-like nuclease (RuvC/YqgF family)